MSNPSAYPTLDENYLNPQDALPTSLYPLSKEPEAFGQGLRKVDAHTVMSEQAIIEARRELANLHEQYTKANEQKFGTYGEKEEFPLDVFLEKGLRQRALDTIESEYDYHKKDYKLSQFYGNEKKYYRPGLYKGLDPRLVDFAAQVNDSIGFLESEASQIEQMGLDSTDENSRATLKDIQRRQQLKTLRTVNKTQ